MINYITLHAGFQADRLVSGACVCVLQGRYEAERSEKPIDILRQCFSVIEMIHFAYNKVRFYALIYVIE